MAIFRALQRKEPGICPVWFGSSDRELEALHNPSDAWRRVVLSATPTSE
jgi:hypothetical protein